VSYTWTVKRRSDSWTGNRNVSAITGAPTNRIQLASGDANVALGKLFEIRSSSTAANNAAWTIAAVTSTSDFYVAEALVTQGASGNGVANVQGNLKLTRAITAFLDAQTIQAAGANFVTNGTRPGDRVGIYGDANNNGSYYITRVLDEDRAWVASRALAANPLVVAAATGTLVVYDGFGDLRITDEAAVSWTSIRTAFPALVESETILTQLTLQRIRAIRNIEIEQTGATSTEWVSEDEIVIHTRADSLSMPLRHLDTGRIALQSSLRLGRPGADDYSFSFGSAWFPAPSVSSLDLAPGIFDTLRLRAFGSLLYLSAGSADLGYLGQLVGCVWKRGGPIIPGLSATAGENKVLQNAMGGAPIVYYDDVTIRDLFIGYGTGSAVIAVAESPIIADFRLADDAFDPPWRLQLVDMVRFRDPKEDYPLAELTSYADATSLALVEYGWFPRFVRLDPTGTTPIPVAGLTVHVYETAVGGPAEIEVAGSPWVTDAQGRINGGIPVYLKARGDVYVPPRTSYEYVQRFTVEGPRVRFINDLVKMRAPLDVDIRVQLMETDFEGEVST